MWSGSPHATLLCVNQAARQQYTFRQYVDLEQLSPVKHEFLNGEVWAMAGGTPEHSAIAVNITTLLSEQLRGRPCRVFNSDLRVRVVATGLGTYPDVSVVCDGVQQDPEDPTGTTIVNPRLVVEVLSPSTEDYDRGEKLENYKQVESLEEIVLVAHDARRVDVWRKVANSWALDTIEDGAAALNSLDVTLPLAEIYRNPLAQ